MEAFFHHYLLMWKHYSNFSGRTGVAGFWCAFLCNVIVSAICGLLGLGGLYGLISLVPMLAMIIRRLNDAAKPWLWALTYFIPVVGWLILAFMLCKPSID